MKYIAKKKEKKREEALMRCAIASIRMDVCIEEYVDIKIMNRTRGITACSLRSNLVFVAYC